MIAEDTLLEGAWYALEQAGRLLEAAVLLDSAADSTTALALALFAREELGRAKLLQGFAENARNGTPINEVLLKKRLSGHESKQREGATGATIRIVPGTRLSDAVKDGHDQSLTHERRRHARSEVQAAAAAVLKRDPSARHAMRERSLYVDLLSGGVRWSRPVVDGAEGAREGIEDAIGDYAIALDALRHDVISQDYPEMARVRACMNPAPRIAPVPQLTSRSDSSAPG